MQTKLLLIICLIIICNKFSIAQTASFEIKNYLGQVVLSTPFTSQINISSISEGMYFLTIRYQYNLKYCQNYKTVML